VTVTYPLNQLLTWATWRVMSFRLDWRQEHSRTAGGEIIARDLGPALWRATYATVPTTKTAMVELEARMSRLRGSIGTFRAWDLRRPAPANFASGTGFGTPTIKAVQADGTQVQLQGLTAGAVIARGDYMSWNDAAGRRALHRATDEVTADGSGDTGWIDVEPALIASVAVSTSVTLAEANCLMRVVPGSMSVDDAGPFIATMTFDAVQDYPA
jgi:hypothetical protein